MLGAKQSTKFKPHQLLISLHKVCMSAAAITAFLILTIFVYFPEALVAGFVGIFFLILFSLPTIVYFRELSRLETLRLELRSSLS